jgi:hypothetical protein
VLGVLVADDFFAFFWLVLMADERLSRWKTVVVFSAACLLLLAEFRPSLYFCLIVPLAGCPPIELNNEKYCVNAAQKEI